MRLIVLSDSHNKPWPVHVPDGDVLIHCGDFTTNGTVSEITQFNAWITSQPHKQKFYIAGNHDLLYQHDPAFAINLVSGAVYVQDQEVNINGHIFYFSPWVPKYGKWAFMKHDEDLQIYWDNIPSYTDVLITHGPPYGILDLSSKSNIHVGSKTLLAAVEKIKPKYHLFGHVHEAHAVAQNEYTTFANVAVCNRQNDPVHSATVIDI